VGQHTGFLGIALNGSRKQFNVVFLMEVVEHVLADEFDEFLDRAIRFVRPGGYLIASTPHNENLDQASVYCPLSDTFFHPWQHVRSFTHTQLVDCFSKVGLRKEFLALADFSCDAELVENQKRMSAADQKRQAAIRKVLADIEELTTRAQLLPLELALDEGAASRQQHSNAYVDSATGMLRDIHGLLANALATDEGLSQPPTRTDDGVDLRIGKETTIVYVGKK
jgi:predicted SAM-dependent methyltransferase